jgi:hypothetical protein
LTLLKKTKMNELTIKISQWIDTLLHDYAPKAQSCSGLMHKTGGYFPPDFLEDSFFVVAADLPKLDIPELTSVDQFADFINMPADGITYRNMYFIKPECADDIGLHLHELTHVMQWKMLGNERYIERYMYELSMYGYDRSPLETMAKMVQRSYPVNPVCVKTFLEQTLKSSLHAN